jgi:serine/threonine protein kinase
MFALGVIAYRALTGRLPFAAVRDAAPHIAAYELCPDAPRELATLIDAMLAADRFDRPSASEVRAELDWMFSSLPALQTPAERTAAPLISPHDVVLLERPRLRRPRWTPDVHYLETTDVDIDLETVDDDAE